MAAQFTKRERAELRELAGEVYEAELGALLEDLARCFEDWRTGKLLGSEVAQAIHEFHQGPSRQLWSMYQTLKADDIVARAIALGMLSDDKVAHELLAKLQPMIGFFRNR